MADEEKMQGLENQARLCHLVMDQGTKGLRCIFNSIYPPLCLREQLHGESVKRLLQRLSKKKTITKLQWKLIYPSSGKKLSSKKYGFNFLVVLLKNICHLSAPYPDGWDSSPLAEDTSLAADIARLTCAKEDLMLLHVVKNDEFVPYWEGISEVLTRVMGDESQVIIDEMRVCELTTATITEYVNVLKNCDKLEEKMEVKAATTLATRLNRVRKGSQVPKDEKEEKGITIEERTVLLKASKMLSEKVQADNLLDKLEFYRVINGEQRREIVKSQNNVENIAYLMSIIQGSKLSSAYTSMCEALSAAYPDVAMEMSAIQSEIAKDIADPNKSDVLIYTRQVLSDAYTERFSNMNPLPWLENVMCTIQDIYVPLNISDHLGRIVDPCDMIRRMKQWTAPRHVILHGESGTGQTMTCEYLAYMWATNQCGLHRNYDLLIYLDVQKPGDTLIDMIYDQSCPHHYNVQKQDLAKILEKNQSAILYCLDGYINDEQNEEVQRLVSGKLYSESSVFITSGMLTTYAELANPIVLYNFGLSNESIPLCMERYANLEMCTKADILVYMESISHDLDKIQIFKNPFMCMVSTVVGTYLGWDTLSVALCDCDRLELYTKTMTEQFCERQCKHAMVLPEELHETQATIQRHAFNSLLRLRKNDTEEGLAYRYGCFRRVKTRTDKWQGAVTFLCDVMRDFLAAKYLAVQTEAEMVSKMERFGLLRGSRYKRAVSFVCRLVQKYEKLRGENESQEADDEDAVYKPALTEIHKLFIMITQQSMRRSKSISFADDVCAEMKGRTRGKVVDFSIELECLNQCHFDERVIALVYSVMPMILVVRQVGILPRMTLQGLRQVLGYKGSIISEIVINLSEIHKFQIWEVEKLGMTIANHEHISSLKVSSSSLKVMTLFLARCLHKNRAMHKVYLELSTDVWPRRCETVDTRLQAALHCACTGMSNVSELHVRNLTTVEIVEQIIHCIPETVVHLDLSGCTLNTMSTHEISRMLRHSPTIKHLDLTNIHVDTTGLLTIMQGVRLSRSLDVLNLSYFVFVPSTFRSLCETLRLNKSLRTLYLNKCSMTTAMAVQLTQVLGEQQMLLENVYIIDARLTQEAKVVLRSASNNWLKIWPVTEKSGLSPVVGGS